MSEKIRVWDLPVRIFHWVLVLSVVGLVATGKIGGSLIDWHGRIGVFLAGLLAFRLVWGIVGSDTARFSQFMPTPARVSAYLRGEWRGVGHNPLGALSVFALLGLLTVQIVTGLFANDDIAFVGPLYPLIDRELSNLATRWHLLLVNALIALIALHVLVIIFYVRVKRKNLLKPMILGWRDRESTDVPGPGIRHPGGTRAFLLALLMALLAGGLASGVWLPEPPPVVVDTPAW